MGARVRIPLWVLLPCAAVSIVALGAIAAGAAGVSATDGYLTRQTDSELLACADAATGQHLAAWPASRPVLAGACDLELLTASGQELTPPAPGPVIPADRSWLAAHRARPVTVPGARGSWRVLLEAVHYQPQRIMFIGGPDNTEYAIGGPAAPGPAGWLVMTAGVAGVGSLAERAAAAAGVVLVLLAVAGLAVTRAILRRETVPWPFAAALASASERMSASRAAEAEARRSVAEMTGRLSEVSRQLRTSVSIVRGFAESRAARGQPPRAARDPMMRRAADEIARMETLVAQLDAVSRWMK
jgi:signal transduction histidine kinase